MPPLLVARGLEKRYGRVEALSGVDLEVGEGQLVGLLGPNGAGKSTLVKIACGLVRASAGQVEVCGAPAGSLPARNRFALKLRYCLNCLRDRLEALWDRVRLPNAPGPRAALIIGDPGFGKSRLADHFARRAGEVGATVIVLETREYNSFVPFHPFAAALLNLYALTSFESSDERHAYRQGQRVP